MYKRSKISNQTEYVECSKDADLNDEAVCQPAYSTKTNTDETIKENESVDILATTEDVTLSPNLDRNTASAANYDDECEDVTSVDKYPLLELPDKGGSALLLI